MGEDRERNEKRRKTRESGMSKKKKVEGERGKEKIKKGK